MTGSRGLDSGEGIAVESECLRKQRKKKSHRFGPAAVRTPRGYILPTDLQPGLISILLIVGRVRFSLVCGIQDVSHTT